jgi:hypothetical protein
MRERGVHVVLYPRLVLAAKDEWQWKLSGSIRRVLTFGVATRL